VVNSSQGDSCKDTWIVDETNVEAPLAGHEDPIPC